MTLGRGLESLIPNKRNGGNQDQGGVQPAPSGNFSGQGDAPKPVPQNEQKPGGDWEQSERNQDRPQQRPHTYDPGNNPVVISRPPRGDFEEIDEGEEREFSPKDAFDARRGSAYRSGGRDFQRGEAVFQIEVDKIRPNPYQPRRVFDEAALRELAQSIREFGILQPLIVSKAVKETESGADVEYQLIAGERRLMAAKLVGLARVPAIIRTIDVPRLRLELALIENLQRSDLSPLEMARAYARLQDEFGLAQREVASRVGKSREVVANTLRLLNLPSPIQEALAQGRINESQARTLLSALTPAEQTRLFYELLEKRTSVRELRRKTAPAPGASAANPEQRYWERQLEEHIGAPVKFLGDGERGKIVIEFYSAEERQALLKKLLDEETGGGL